MKLCPNCLTWQMNIMHYCPNCYTVLPRNEVSSEDADDGNFDNLTEYDEHDGAATEPVGNL